MKRNGPKAILSVLALLAGLRWLAGCVMVGPDYRPPVTQTPATWSAAPGGGLSTAAADTELLERWWTVLDDPILDDLIERARTGNLEVRQAEARVREARAQRGIARADLFPTVGTNFSANRTGSSEEAGSGSTSDLFLAGFDASWELDVFGGKRRSLESATASLQASEESLRDVLVSLLAEVALNYVEVRSLQELLSITESNVTTRSETYDLTRWRREAGLTTQLDVDQARLSLEQVRAQVPTLRTSLAQARYRLAVLLGEAPGALDEQLAEPTPVPVPSVEVAVGVPADLLRRRPDVRTAERQLAAQTAEIGVAEAALYPDLTILGSVGLESLTFPNLFSASALATQGAANSAWTLFQGGAIRQNIKVQTARQEQALSYYEATVLGALKDVESAMVAYANEQTRRSALADGVVAGQSAFELARYQYDSGVVSFQTVLDTQQSLLTVQDLLAASEAKVTSNLISLYKALGGGWVPANPDGSTAQNAGDSASREPAKTSSKETP